MRPTFQVVEERLAGARSALQLADAQQFKVGGDVPPLQALPDQHFGGDNLPIGRQLLVEGAHEGDADALRVVGERVRALAQPSPALVRVPVAAYEEVEADVPIVGAFDVEGLQEADVEGAGGLVPAPFRRRVRYNHVRHWLRQQRDVLRGRLGQPFFARYNF